MVQLAHLQVDRRPPRRGQFGGAVETPSDLPQRAYPVALDARGQVGGVLDRRHGYGEGGLKDSYQFGHWDQILRDIDGEDTPSMYTRAYWEDVNNIKATCTSIVRPNLSIYFVLLMYTDVQKWTNITLTREKARGLSPRALFV